MDESRTRLLLAEQQSRAHRWRQEAQIRHALTRARCTEPGKDRPLWRLGRLTLVWQQRCGVNC